MTGAALQLAQFALVLAAAPLLTGWVRWLKARLTGRRGAPPIQPYRDLARLLRKEAVVAEHASWLTRAAPYAVFALAWLTAALVPALATRLPLAPAADLIALAGLIAAARFLLVLAALDAGTAFGRLGAAREATIGALAEPALLLAAFTVALFVRSTSLPGIAEFVLTGEVGLRVSFALALAALAIVALAENGRLPFDNPATHLELTMVHEAMALEYSGRHLALVEAAAMLRLVFAMALIAALFVPWGLAIEPTPAALGLALVTFVAKLVLGGVLLAGLEVSIARLRLFRIGELLGGALLLGLLGSMLLYVSQAP